MSAAAPNPNQLLLLAAVGIGVYWFMSRRAVAATPAAAAPAGVSNPYRAQNVANTVANVVGSLSRYFNGGTTPGTYDGRAAVPWDTSGGGNNPSAYVASSAVDGVAANVPNSATYDAVDMGSTSGADLSLFY